MIVASTVVLPVLLFTSASVDSSYWSSLTEWAVSNIFVGAMGKSLLYSLTTLRSKKLSFFGVDVVGYPTSSQQIIYIVVALIRSADMYGCFCD